VVSGLVAGSTMEATREAGRLADAGADALLVFPPHTTINHRRETAVGYIEAIGDAVDIPLVLFQHPVWGGGTYDSDLLVELASLDPVVAVKNACWEMDRFQDDVYALQEAGVDTQLLVANDEHLLASYAVRTDGTILILAAVIPELIVEMHEAIEAGDLATARRAYQQADPLIRLAFADPVADSNARLKKMLELEGTFPNAVPRPPARPVEPSEIPAIERVMERAGLSVPSPPA
ncbi:MAG: dihydrodipicolinate synthase family protein, partial [Halobacteriales archaeon]|nr:dihydrodipicolinate synthase family protein [Halobacteriales archaeon]